MADPAEGGGSEQDDVSFLRTVSTGANSCAIINEDFFTTSKKKMKMYTWIHFIVSAAAQTENRCVYERS